jgi:hypothetical protein
MPMIQIKLPSTLPCLDRLSRNPDCIFKLKTISYTFSPALGNYRESRRSRQATDGKREASFFRSLTNPALDQTWRVRVLSWIMALPSFTIYLQVRFY